MREYCCSPMGANLLKLVLRFVCERKYNRIRNECRKKKKSERGVVTKVADGDRCD